MAEIDYSMVSLRIGGDDLVPEEITTLLGATPRYAVFKGERGENGKRVVGPIVNGARTAKSGMWLIDAELREPENIDAQIKEIFSKVTNDLAVWQGLGRRFKMDIYCGLFLKESDNGMTISPQSLALLGERGIELSMCIYAPTEEVRPTDPCPCRSGKTYAECCAPKSPVQ
jgi:hypothetical protein